MLYLGIQSILPKVTLRILLWSLWQATECLSHLLTTMQATNSGRSLGWTIIFARNKWCCRCRCTISKVTSIWWNSRENSLDVSLKGRPVVKILKFEVDQYLEKLFPFQAIDVGCKQTYLDTLSWLSCQKALVREGTRFSLIITDRFGDAYGISWLNSDFRCCSVIEFAACQSARCICRAPRSTGCWDAVTWQHHGENQHNVMDLHAFWPLDFTIVCLPCFASFSV